MGTLVHTCLGSSYLLAHVLHCPPPPPRTQLYNRSCSNKHTHKLSHSVKSHLRQHLPAELAQYIRDTYSEYWVAGQFPKIRGEALSWPQILDLCATVQPSQRGISQEFCHSHGCTEVHLEVFNALEIVCSGVPGQVNRTRLRRASTSIRYGTCFVC